MRSHPIIDALRLRREELGLSSRALSLRMGYGEETVRHWESGQNYPTVRSLQDWVQSLGMKLKVERGDE
mgnify:CR=1 FL=1